MVSRAIQKLRTQNAYMNLADWLVACLLGWFFIILQSTYIFSSKLTINENHPIYFGNKTNGSTLHVYYQSMLSANSNKMLCKSKFYFFESCHRHDIGCLVSQNYYINHANVFANVCLRSVTPFDHYKPISLYPKTDTARRR